MEALLNTEMWMALFTLSLLEIVLGVDNLVFISIAVGKLPQARRSSARRFGLALACITRILLLVSLAWLSRMAQPIIEVMGNPLSIRDLVLIGGGLFLLIKGTMEIHDTVEGGENEPPKGRASPAFGLVIVQIAIIDIVFSLDSVITAIGMVEPDAIWVMISAIVLAMLVMLLASDPIGEFIDRHPTIKMLALAFLLLVGMALIADGFDMHIPRAYLYFAMAFSGGVEGLNLIARRRQNRRKRKKDDDDDVDRGGGRDL